jgi:hypothetical protein
MLDDAWAGQGVTNELFTITPYDVPQAWAACLQRAGWEGLINRLRHGLSPERFGLALFGDTGTHHGDSRFVTEPSEPFSETMVRAFSVATTILVERAPVSSASLHVIS